MKYLKFSASWCQPCRDLEPTMDKLRAAGHLVEEVPTETQHHMFERFGVKNVPTVIAVDPQGNEVKRWVGIQNYKTYLNI